jgi:ankyrin repeat protein
MKSLLHSIVFTVFVHSSFMRYLRTALTLLLLYTSCVPAMNIQVPATETSTNVITFFIPHEIWKKWVCISSCKNMLKFVNRYLHALASPKNQEELIVEEDLSISLSDCLRITVDSVYQDKCMQAYFALQAINKLGIKCPTSITNFGTPIWYYARSQDMIDLLDQFGPRPHTIELHDIHYEIISTARLGDIENFKKELDRFVSHATQQPELKSQITPMLTLAACHACQTNQIECFTLLLPHIDNKDQLTLSAIEDGNTVCLGLLLEAHANQNCIDTEGNTPLINAAREGKISCAQFLLEHGADQMIANRDGLRPLNYALQNNHTDIVELLTRALPNTKENTDYLHAAALYNACIQGDVKTVAHALDAGHSIIPLALPDQETVLHLAAAHGHSVLIELLIKRGFSINAATDIMGHTPLFMATNDGHLDAVRALHDAGADIHAKLKSGMSLCACAVINNHFEILKYLASHGADLKEVSPQGETLLHHAADTKKSGPITKYLLEQGLSYNQIWNLQHNGLVIKTTPLHGACSGGNLSAAKELVAAGASMEGAIDDGSTPIMAACGMGRTKIVQFFLEEYFKRNKLPNHTLFNELTLYATLEGHYTVVELLLDAGARVNDSLIAVAHVRKYSELEQLLRKVQEERRGISW